jgi:hypothetical protein
MQMDDTLYKKAIKIVDKQYGSKTSAYRSMAIVKKYKQLGGEYKGPKNKQKGVTRWLDEKWIQVHPYLTDGSHVACGLNKRRAHACRPSVKLSKETPMTIQEAMRKHGHLKLLELITHKNKNSEKYRVDWVTGQVSMVNKSTR